jgi:hypothetical protein
MAEILVVQADLGGSIVPDGVRAGLFLGGPADEAVLDLPAWGGFTASVVRLLIDDQSAKYFAVSIGYRPGRPRLYCWDDPNDDGIAHELQRRIGQAARS